MEPIEIAAEILAIPESERSLQSVTEVIQAYLFYENHPVIRNALRVYVASLNNERCKYLGHLDRLHVAQDNLCESIDSLQEEIQKVQTLLGEKSDDTEQRPDDTVE